MSKLSNTKVLVAGSGVASPDLSSDPLPTVAAATAGQLTILKVDMTPADDNTADLTVLISPEIYAVEKRPDGTNSKWSQKIQGNQISKFYVEAGTAAVEQISYVGDNGTSGNLLPVIDDSDYTISIIFTNDKVQGSERQMVRRMTITSDASATGTEIMNALVAAINADPVASKYVVAAAETGGGNVGIKITGLAISSKAAGTYSKVTGYEQVRFEVAAGGAFTTATQIDEFGFIGSGAGASNGPSAGKGTAEQVSDAEYAAIYAEGISNFTKFPTPSYAISSDQITGAKIYDAFTVEFGDKHASANLNKDLVSPERLVIYTEHVTAGAFTDTTYSKSIQEYLSKYCASVGVPQEGATLS